MPHHLTKYFASQKNQRQVLWPRMLVPSEEMELRGEWQSEKYVRALIELDMVVFWKVLHPTFWFSSFYSWQTIGFLMKNKRLITGEKTVIFCCISTSSAVSATPYIFWGKVGKLDWKGVMIVVVRPYWVDFSISILKWNEFFLPNLLMGARGAGTPQLVRYNLCDKG